MSEEKLPLENIHWPETMWPINTDILKTLPLELLPNIDQLNKLNYPWELLTLLRNTLIAKITKSRISERTKIDRIIHIDGPVWIEDDVTIYPFSVIIGPTFIGKGTTIGNFTQIRNSLIGQGSLIGERTSVVRSVVNEGCVFHRNYIGDSLLAKDVDMGGGTTTANRRLDRTNIKSTINDTQIDTGMETLGAVIGKGTKFGTTCQIMPGVKIGSNCIVGPRAILFTDLPNGAHCKVKQELIIK